MHVHTQPGIVCTLVPSASQNVSVACAVTRRPPSSQLFLLAGLAEFCRSRPTKPQTPGNLEGADCDTPGDTHWNGETPLRWVQEEIGGDIIQECRDAAE